MHRDLSGEAAQLTMEYTEIHNCIQTDDIHTFIPECWAGFVPLKSEYYKAVAHYHAAKSIRSSRSDDTEASSSTGKKRIDTVQQQNNFVFDESSLDSDVCPTALRMAHVKESLACHDEAQRLQRMCRDLKVLIITYSFKILVLNKDFSQNKMSLTKILHEAYLRTVCESESLDEENKKTLIEDEFDVIEARINGILNKINE